MNDEHDNAADDRAMLARVTERKFYHNAITVEWVSSEPWGDEATDLDTVHYEITEGSSIGYITRTVANAGLTRDEAVQRDIAYGGDGTFIVAGLDLDDDEEDQ